jgi:hypothetical protein
MGVRLQDLHLRASPDLVCVNLMCEKVSSKAHRVLAGLLICPFASFFA